MNKDTEHFMGVRTKPETKDLQYEYENLIRPLEELWDRYGFRTIVQALGEICYKRVLAMRAVAFRDVKNISTSAYIEADGEALLKLAKQSKQLR